MPRHDPLVVLHLAPHPDDEAIGAPATLLALREQGHRVINAACSLGHADDRERRLREVRHACERAAFELALPPQPLGLSRDDDLTEAQRELTVWIQQLVDDHGVALVVSPSPHDGHHGHEVVGRAARDALWTMRSRELRWWMWGLWADLPLPTLFFGFGEDRLRSALDVLAAHEGELARNDYAALVRARAVASRVLGAERVFGWGSRGQAAPYAELLTEAGVHDSDWLTGPPRVLEPAAPLAPLAGGVPIGWWLRQRSFRTELSAVIDDLAATRSRSADP